MVWRMLYDWEIEDPQMLIDFRLGREACIIEVRKEDGEIRLLEEEKEIPFSFYELRDDINYHLTLDSRHGLLQKVNSTETVFLGDDKREVIAHMPDKPCGNGGYGDFRVVGSYAATRFVHIGEELSESPLLISEDFSSSLREVLEDNGQLYIEGDPDAKLFQSIIIPAFYRNFCAAFDESPVVDNEQREELRRLVSSLAGF